MILHESLRMPNADLSCVIGEGTSTVPGLSQPDKPLDEILSVYLWRSLFVAHQTKAHPNLTVMPLLGSEFLYIGVDIGKFKHVAGFISKTLLARHERFEDCPTIAFDQSRDGFRAFVDRIREYAPLEHATLLYVRYNQGIRHRCLIVDENTQ